MSAAVCHVISVPTTSIQLCIPHPCLFLVLHFIRPLRSDDAAFIMFTMVMAGRGDCSFNLNEFRCIGKSPALPDTLGDL